MKKVSKKGPNFCGMDPILFNKYRIPSSLPECESLYCFQKMKMKNKKVSKKVENFSGMNQIMFYSKARFARARL